MPILGCQLVATACLWLVRGRNKVLFLFLLKSEACHLCPAASGGGERKMELYWPEVFGGGPNSWEKDKETNTKKKISHRCFIYGHLPTNRHCSSHYTGPPTVQVFFSFILSMSNGMSKEHVVVQLSLQWYYPKVCPSRQLLYQHIMTAQVNMSMSKNHLIFQREASWQHNFMDILDSKLITFDHFLPLSERYRIVPCSAEAQQTATIL